MTPLPRLLALGAFLPALLLAAPKPVDSAHYRAVRDRVGDGGQVFVYVDVDGYFTELGHELTTSVAAAAGDDASLALWKQDYAAVFTELGLAQIKAVGLSSRQLAPDRFVNRIYLHVPEGRRGLLQFFGGAAHPFASAQLAPADADLFVETELDLSALCTTTLQLLQRISPELAAQFPGQLPSTNELSGLAALTSLTQFKGRFTAVVRLHGETAFGPESEFPHDVLIGTDAHGPQFLALLRMRYPELKAVKTEGTHTFYSTGAKLPGLPAPLCLVAEGERLQVATSEAFLRECLDRKTGLAQAPAFTQALAATATTGNSVVFATPRLFATVREAVAMVTKLTHPDRFEQSSYRFFLDRLARITEPVVSVTSNLPDGVLVQSVGPDSLRESLPLLGLLTPDLAGNILRVALPAHVAKQYASRVAERQAGPVRENLARISAVATAYFAKNAESEQVAFADLLALDPALADLKPVEDEDYSTVTIQRARDAVEVATMELGTVTYARPLTDDEKARIERNLALYDEASSLYFAAKPDESTMSAYDAISAGSQLTETPASVVGEEYEIQVERDATTIEVRTPGGTTISHPRTPGLRWTALKRRAQQVAAIRENLAILYSVATDYLGQHPDERYVSGSELFGQGEDKPRPALRPVAGEDYDEVRVTRTRAGATISVPHLGEISYEAPLPKDEVAAIQTNLRAIAKAAKTYFAKHPQENLVVVGELVGEGQPIAAAPKAIRGEDYLPLVLERGAKTLSLTLPTTQSVAIDTP